MTPALSPIPARYLTQIDNEPAETRLALVRGIMDRDPLGLFRELRAGRPILALNECVLVSRYDDVIEMLNMPKIFTVVLYRPKMANNYLMMHDDDALHYREKSIMQGLLNRDDLPEVRGMVGRIASSLLKEAAGKIDAVGGYCRHVPAAIVRDYFGLIGIPLADLMEWSYWAQVDTFYNQPFDIVTPEERKNIEDQHAATGKKLGEYLAALMLTKSVARKFAFLNAPVRGLKRMISRVEHKVDDDIVSRMMRTRFPHEMDFDLQRAGVNAGGLLIGTIETTAQATVQAIQFLLQKPELLEMARNAAKLENPAQFDGIVWEALRFVPISPYMFRQTSEEYTLGKGTGHETVIPAATNVLALTQSAMFDDRAFEKPEEFRPDRNWYNYFTFGYGSHECLGKYVGMVMIPEIVRQILMMPGLEASGEIVYDGHMPKSYDLTWRP